MSICIATIAYCIVLNVIAHAVEIETGFPTACGIPNFKREYKEEAESMKAIATKNSWPWHVGLRSTRLGSFPFCGGTIISNTLILTSAHCLTLHFACIKFTVGIEFRVFGATPYLLQILTVESAIVHPKFNQDASYEGYDIAILKVLGKITISDRVKPICFPSSHVNLQRGSLCFFAGWGNIPLKNGMYTPKVLREGQIEIDNDEYCDRLYLMYNNDHHSCIKTHGTNPCSGDSGGGLFCPSEDNDSWFWYGMIRSGSDDCLADWAIVNKISAEHSWIKDTAKVFGL
uniref:Chymotrypsin-like protease CTRL-1 n=1 Tax=Schistocephalus solidus TaxID=70667 RepID=A0A0V0J695_SCHSO